MGGVDQQRIAEELVRSCAMPGMQIVEQPLGLHRVLAALWMNLPH